MAQVPESTPQSEKVEVQTAKRRWAAVGLAAFVGGASFFAAYFLTGRKSLPILVIAAVFLMFNSIAREKLRRLERRRTGKPAEDSKSFTARVFLLGVMFPILGVFVLVASIMAVIRGTDVLSAIGRGALLAAVLTVGVGLLQIVTRIIGRLL